MRNCRVPTRMRRRKRRRRAGWGHGSTWNRGKRRETGRLMGEASLGGG